MCGIVGIINHKGTYLSGAERLLRDMLTMDQVRGADGTGIFWSRGRKEFGWVKLDSNAMDFMATDDAIDALRQTENYLFVVGHNRAATSGGVKLETTQPIEDGPIALVHNGTLSSWPTRYKESHYNPQKGLEHTMDTMGIAYLLANKDIRYVNEHCYGAMSLVWYDERDQSLNFFRNKDRPMFILPTEKATLFGSEPGMLYWASARNDYHRNEKQTMWSTRPFAHYKWFKKSEKPHVVEIPEKTYFQQGSHNSSYYGAPNTSDDKDTSDPPEDSPGTKVTPGKQRPNPKLTINRGAVKVKQKQIKEFDNYKIGSMVVFSLRDVKKKKNVNQKFVEIEGEPLDSKKRNQYMFHANTSLDERLLYDNQFYLSGEVTDITQEKNTAFVHFFLSDIKITGTKDPEWAKPTPPSPPKPPYRGRIDRLEDEIAAASKPTKPPLFAVDATYTCSSCNKHVPGNEASVLTFNYRSKSQNEDITKQKRHSIFLCPACVNTWDEHGSEVLLPKELKNKFITLDGSTIHSVARSVQ
jgi:predicted glutamine amidotransferase